MARRAASRSVIIGDSKKVMMAYYNVFEKGKYITVVKAVSAKDACKQVYMQRGSASRYSGNSLHNYTAEQVHL